MAAIKSIKVGETVYDLKAIYDGSGNVIDQTYAKSSAIPTKVSQLQNDENYLKEHQDISGLATKTELESKVDKELGKGLSEANYTETEKQKLSGIADNANNYTHPSGSGNNHIPSGGSSGQILKWQSDGAATWGNEISYSEASGSSAGLMSSADKTKLEGIEAQANKYVLPAAGASLGGVKQGTAVADASTELASAENVAAQLNALLASLRTAGVIATE